MTGANQNEAVCNVCHRELEDGDSLISIVVNGAEVGRNRDHEVQHAEEVATLCVPCARQTAVTSIAVGDAIGRTLTIIAPADPE